MGGNNVQFKTFWEIGIDIFYQEGNTLVRAQACKKRILVTNIKCKYNFCLFSRKTPQDPFNKQPRVLPSFCVFLPGDFASQAINKLFYTAGGCCMETCEDVQTRLRAVKESSTPMHDLFHMCVCVCVL